jgi:hypothetical protein
VEKKNLHRLCAALGKSPTLADFMRKRSLIRLVNASQTPTGRGVHKMDKLKDFLRISEAAAVAQRFTVVPIAVIELEKVIMAWRAIHLA